MIHIGTTQKDYPFPILIGTTQKDYPFPILDMDTSSGPSVHMDAFNMTRILKYNFMEDTRVW